jgi:hypothetical protein
MKISDLVALSKGLLSNYTTFLIALLIYGLDLLTGLLTE